MLSWKDKVTENLSRLFYNSTTSQSPPLDQSQAGQDSKEGKSFSSMFSFIRPSTSSDGFTPVKDRQENKPIQSLPVKWESGNISWRDNHFDIYEECDHECQNKGTPNSHEFYQEHGSGWSTEHENKGALNTDEDRNPGSGRSTSSSDAFEDATDSHNVEKSIPYLTEDSFFISSDLHEFLLASLPNIVKGCQWILLYSTVKHGISLRTLIRRSADISGPCLLIVGDKQGAVFGGLLECPLKPTPKRKYQGTNQTFVFTTIYGEPRLFRPTGANRYFYLCLNDLLALGGGGNFALCLDGDLLTGTSGACETFGNSCLAHSEEFELKNVELWGFTHSSRYLT